MYRISPFFLLLLFASHSTANIVRVSLSGNGTGGDTWQSAYPSVSAGLVAAASGDDLWIAQGTYHETITLKTGVNLFGGFAGTETDNEFSSRDWVSNQTILDASGFNDSVIKATSVKGATVDGLTITGGYATFGGGVFISDSTITFIYTKIKGNFAHPPGNYAGGGIYAIDSSVQLIDSEISQNSARLGGGVYQLGGRFDYSHSSISNNGNVNGQSESTLQGGGIYGRLYAFINVEDSEIRNNYARSEGGGCAVFTYSTLSIEASIISDNTLKAGYGGGVQTSASTLAMSDSIVSNNKCGTGFGATGGGLYILGEAVISGCTLVSNFAYWGGGARVTGGDVTIADCMIEDNEAMWGGGLMVDNRDAICTIQGCVFRLNTASEGGGLYVENNECFVSQCAITGNRVLPWRYGPTSDTVSGGGIYLASEAQFRKCDISNNHSTDLAGGIFAFGYRSAFENCLVTANVSQYRGGGLYIVASPTLPEFRFCTFANNDAPKGPAIFVNTTELRLDSCVLKGATSGEIVLYNDPIVMDNYGGSAVATISYSNISGDWEGEGNIDADPLFRDPANGDYRLQAHSPCIDSASIAGPLDDLDGNPRPIDIGGVGRDGSDAFDMGAYEFQTVISDLRSDINGDGIVDAVDLMILLEDYKQRE